MNFLTLEALLRDDVTVQEPLKFKAYGQELVVPWAERC